MEVSLDKFGRIVLPKPLRDRLGLEAGDVIDIDVTADGALRLQPRGERPLLVRESGVLVYAGTATEDLADAVARHRDGRLRALGGRSSGR